MHLAIIITALIFIAYASLMIFYRIAWKSIPRFSQEQISMAAKASLIIPARNEEQNIVHCLNSLKDQSCSKDLYEVIVVDDHSTDNTWTLLQNFPAGEMNLKKLKLSDYIAVSDDQVAYKKLAIETAIHHAAGDLIITSDADCTFNADWLQTILSFHEKTNAKFIAAPVKITCRHNLLDIFQTIDFITLQGITGASVFKKFHSMCNGANLAYEKKAFFEVDGFKDIDHIPSGDDMLLMHKIRMRYPSRVLYLKNENAIVNTQPQTSWKNFFNQRIRWASKADMYEDKQIFRVLLLVYCFNLMFAVLAIAAFWNIRYLFIAFALLVLKIFVELLFVRPVAKFFGQQSLMIYFPFLQPAHILYIIISGFFGKFGSYQWKGRKVVSTR